MNQENFMIAVAVTHYLDGPKSDPRFVKWVSSYRISTDDSSEKVHYPMHRCTDEDFSRFYPPDNISAAKINKLQEADELFCIHQKVRDRMLYGGFR